MNRGFVSSRLSYSIQSSPNSVYAKSLLRSSLAVAGRPPFDFSLVAPLATTTLPRRDDFFPNFPPCCGVFVFVTTTLPRLDPLPLGFLLLPRRDLSFFESFLTEVPPAGFFESFFAEFPVGFFGVATLPRPPCCVAVETLPPRLDVSPRCAHDAHGIMVGYAAIFDDPTKCGILRLPPYIMEDNTLL